MRKSLLTIALLALATAALADTTPDGNVPPGVRYEVWIEEPSGAFVPIPGCTTPLNQNVEVVTGANPPAMILYLECDPQFEDGYEGDKRAP